VSSWRSGPDADSGPPDASVFLARPPTGAFQVPIPFQKFHKMVTGEGSGGDLGKLEAFAGVGEFPVRVKCATLAWHRLRAAIQGKQDTVSTEE